jgi:ABC-type lipoprotein release transport system permease subunit
MSFNFTLINQNRGLYISTILTIFVLSSILLLSYGLATKYNDEKHIHNSFMTKESIRLTKESRKSILNSEVSTIEEILGEYDALIKKSFLRVEFSGIAKFNELDHQFIGLGIDLKRDYETFQDYIEIEKGDNLDAQSQNRILISSSIAEKLGVDLNDSLEIYVLNRYEESIDVDVINIASIKIRGIFQEAFNEGSTIFFPKRLAESILKSSNIDSITVEFYLQNDMKRVRDELENKLKPLGFKIETLEIEENEIIGTLAIIEIVLITLLIAVLSYRDNRLLIEKRKPIFSSLINYGWKKSELLVLSFNELLIVNGGAFLIIFSMLYLLFSLNIPYPSLFNNYNIPLQIDFQFIEILYVALGMTLINMGFSALWLSLFSKFKREY